MSHCGGCCILQARIAELSEEEVKQRAEAAQQEHMAANDLLAQVDDMQGDAHSAYVMTISCSIRQRPLPSVYPAAMWLIACMPAQCCVWRQPHVGMVRMYVIMSRCLRCCCCLPAG